MRKALTTTWPLTVSLVFLWGTIAFVLASFQPGDSNPKTRIVYAIDDAYIHMAIAKNLSLYGVFGVTRHHFTSCSSSPLWSLLLTSSYEVFGVNEMTPLVINIFAATIAVFVFYCMLRSQGVPPLVQGIVLLGMIIATPLTPLIFTGMEHCLYLVLAIAFAYVLSGQVSESPSRRQHIFLLCLSPLVTAVRYEGLFLLAVAVFFLVLRGRWHRALPVLALGLVPVLAWGLVSVINKALLLPNSVLLKGQTPDFTSVFGFLRYATRAIWGLSDTPHMLILVLTALILYIGTSSKDRTWSTQQNLLLAFVGVSLLHIQFAKVDWFYRYEAYLVALGILAITVCLSQVRGCVSLLRLRLPNFFLTSACLLVLLIITEILIVRGARALIETPKAMTNIYEQQYQMGLFLRRHYQGSAVAANDIGAITYLADIRLIDLVGLANDEIADKILAETYETSHIDQVCAREDVKIAIVYDEWFPLRRKHLPALPCTWEKAGTWTLRDNVVCACDSVTFYSVKAGERFDLTAHLLDFSARLPKSVQQRVPAIGRWKGVGVLTPVSNSR